MGQAWALTRARAHRRQRQASRAGLQSPAGSADQTGIWKWLPGLYTLRHYQLRWLRSDLVAGLVLTAMLVPVGMGYAEAAGLPAIYGLYATIVPLIAYAIFGPSRILVLGPDSSLAAIIAAVILPLAAGDPDRAVALAGMLAIFTGLLCIVAGLARLGFITELLSKPIRYGYMNGIALTVLVGQLPKLFGFSADGRWRDRGSAGLYPGRPGRRNQPGSPGDRRERALLFILALKRYRRFPGVLVAVVGATLVTGAFDLAVTAGLSVVGSLPQGLPSFTIPAVTLGGSRVRCSSARSPSRWSLLPIPACFRAPGRPARASMSTPTRR